MVNRCIEVDGLLDTLEHEGIGAIVFSPLAQGMLTDKYLNGVPDDSRAARSHFFNPKFLTPENLDRVRQLDAIAKRRGQSLAQMALAWALRDRRVTSALIGASRPQQVVDAVKALDTLAFTVEELKEIDRYAVDSGINLWDAVGRARRVREGGERAPPHDPLDASSLRSSQRPPRIEPSRGGPWTNVRASASSARAISTS